MPDTTQSSTPAHRIVGDKGPVDRDRPWIIRTYSGHSSARASNALYRANLAQGQTGLSIAFDLPTQCGYDSDDPIARPEVGKVGVPINSLDDFHVLFDEIPIESMNTSMTINGTAMWLLALYIALARERGVELAQLTGTTQNDLIKEYLARGTYIFPPDASLRIIAEMYEFCLEEIPSWNASNICSYHLQEAGATPTQELAFALANAIGLLDLLRERGHFDDDQFQRSVGRISFFVNAGIRFVEEMCKMRAFVELWDEITQERYGVTEPKHRRFRYGVQVNSLGLTEAQPENNAWRILIEALGVTLSRDARCRALQLPCWNEALSLPRPWDQQWSLRLQQILAYETDLLEYPDLFEGSVVVRSKVDELKAQARAEIDAIVGMGGVIEAIDNGYMKSALVRSMSERVSNINTGAQVVVGLNKWTDGLASPLVGGEDGGLFTIDDAATAETLESLQRCRSTRDPGRVAAALDALQAAARSGASMMEASIECALARVTTGEWARALRQVFGEYRPATGVDGQRLGLTGDRVEGLRDRITGLVERLGHRPRIVVGKPGLDGHSNGAEVIAVSARHVGFDVIYSGIRLSAEEIVRSAVEEGADVIGASVLSGSHLELAEQITSGLQAAGAGDDIDVVFGGIIPRGDFDKLAAIGVAKVFTPSDYDLMDIMESIVELLEGSRPVIDPEALVERAAIDHDRHSVARLVSLFEDRRGATADHKDRALAALRHHSAGRDRPAPVLGFTGTPGSGKSSLLARLTDTLLAADEDLCLAVVAVDPSSPTSGGALLGDRTRMLPSRSADRLYFRSQASATALGGLAPTTYQVCRALACIYDAVIIETVGIGQSEADIRQLADRVYLVVSPLGGDEVQYLKAGIIEIPDVFIISKWDESSASRGYHQLRSSLWLARPFDAEEVPIHRTSAKTGFGIDELADELLATIRTGGRGPDASGAFFFARWVDDEWGRAGRRHLQHDLGGAPTFLGDSPGTDADRHRFSRSLLEALTTADRPVAGKGGRPDYGTGVENHR